MPLPVYSGPLSARPIDLAGRLLDADFDPAATGDSDLCPCCEGLAVDCPACAATLLNTTPAGGPPGKPTS